MIFFLVHFRRYRKPVKNRYSSTVGESYSRIQNDIVIFIYLSICIGVLPCHLPEESVTQDLQIICYTESPQILQCCRILKEKQEKRVYCVRKHTNNLW